MSHSGPADGKSASAHEPNSYKADYHDLIRAADRLIAESKLGMFGDFIAPFSYQFKTHIRLAYEADQETFTETDKIEAKAIRAALNMRITTFLSYLVLSGAVLLYAWTGFWLDVPNGAYYAVAILAGVAGATTLFRGGVRHEVLHTIGGDATEFANYFFKQLTNIHDRVINAVRFSNSDAQLTAEWPERSAGWIKIALWHGRRYENLDRYVTATAWRVESRFRIIERTSVVLKVLVMLGVLAGSIWLAALGHRKPLEWVLLLACLVIYVLITLRFWGVITRVRNSFWAERFRVSVIGFDEQKEHIHNQIANVVAGDKKQILADKWNVESKKNG